jgi:hypothetical protein
MTAPVRTFNVKAVSLFIQHPTRVAALPTDLRPAARMGSSVAAGDRLS